MDSAIWTKLYIIATKYSDLPQIRQDFIEWLDAKNTVTLRFVESFDADAAWKSYQSSAYNS